MSADSRCSSLDRTLVGALAIVALVVALALAAPAGGAIGSWSSNGPLNADITDLALDPGTAQTVYAASEDGGVHKSIDGGESWAPANTGLPSEAAEFINALAIDPDTPQTLYAATQGGVFKTTNGAASWSDASDGITAAPKALLSLAIDPSEPETLYAGGRFNGGVFKSTDGGGEWSEASSGLVPDEIAALAVDPETPGTVYAGARVTHGVHKSTDGGASWTAAGSGLTVGGVRELAIDPTTPATLYATTFDGVFKSTDGAAGWSATGLGATNVLSLAIDPADPETLYAGLDEEESPEGVHRTTDGGVGWGALGGLPSGSREVTALALTPSGGTVYAGTAHKGVFEYTFEGSGEDDDPPETFITAGPAQGLPTIDPTPSFSFSSDEAGATFSCAVDGGDFEPCDSPLQLGPLDDGAHSFAVFATDQADNPDESPAERSFVVDSDPSGEGLLTQKAGAEGCLAAESHDGCALAAASAREAYSVAVSPDGRNVYSAGATFEYLDGEGDLIDNPVGPASLTVFDRDGDGEGALTPAGVHDLDSGSPVEPGASGFDVAVSPDGANVYATAAGGIEVFDRAPSGALTPAGGPALSGAGRLAISPDGDNVYATTGEELAIFNRAANGGLTPAGEVTPADDPLGFADVVVSPDGDNVYTASTHNVGGTETVVTTFDRAAGGALTQTGCVSEHGAGTCADGFGLENPAKSLAVSPDGSNLYVASSGHFELDVHRGQLAVFDRAGDGSLTQKGGGAGCISGRSQGVPPNTGCSEGGRWLQSITGVAVSPDGANVYVVSWRGNVAVEGGGVQDGAIAALDRAGDGSLTPKPQEICCISQAGGDPSDGRGLVGAYSLAISPDGLSVYVGAHGTKSAFSATIPGAVAVFDREPGALVEDTDPPETTITVGPEEGATIGDDSPLFAFQADEEGAIFSCEVDGGGFEPCDSPLQLGPLDDGVHSFEVFATDQAGNHDESPATRTFTVDAVPGELIVNDEGDGGNDDDGAAREACEEGAANCTLRGALAAANAEEQTNRITFAEGVEEIEVIEDQLVIEDAAAAALDVEIVGPGARALTISEGGGAAHRALLEVEAEAGAMVSDISFSGFSHLDTPPPGGGGTNVTATRTGAAVVNEGELSLSRVAIADSAVEAIAEAGQDATAAAEGGGILNRGDLTLAESTVSGGEAVARAASGKGDPPPGKASAMAVGGGVVNDGGVLRLVRTTVSGNFNAATAADGSPMEASSSGGGIANLGGTVELVESTVAFNTAGLASNLLTESGAASELRSSLLAQPSGGDNCGGGGTVSSAGFNLDDGDSCGLGAGTDLTDADPALDEQLADNGGPTDTHAIGIASEAIDAGDAGPGVSTDQRGAGFPRPVNFPTIADNGDGADIGAYELQPTSEGPVGHPSCSDGFDNDADADVDAADNGCQSGGGPTPSPAPSPTAAPPIVAIPPEIDIPDSGIPGLRATAPRSQKQKGRQIQVEVSVGALEAIRAKASGKVTVGKKAFLLKAQLKRVRGGRRIAIKLKPAKKLDAKKIAAAIKRWRRASGKAKRQLAVKAVLKVVVTDQAGNRQVKRQVVTLR
jgi:hypothetical protein